MTKLDDVLECSKGVKFEGACCILASLTMRDVYRQLGFKAEVKSVAVEMTATAYEAEIPLHTLGVGTSKLWDEPYVGKDWDGHLVVTIEDWIVDPTMYNMRRKVWEWVPNVAVLRREKTKRSRYNLPIIARLSEKIEDIHNYKFEGLWLSYTTNKGWLSAPDYRYPGRRKEFVREILAEFRKDGIKIA